MFLQTLIPLVVLLQFSCNSFQFTGSNITNSENKRNINDDNQQTSQIKDKAAYDEYKKNRRLWESFKFKDYGYTAKVSEGGNINYLNPLLIEVRENQVVSITTTSKSKQGAVGQFKQLDTIEKLFNTIGEGYKKDYETKIKYDKEYGFPTYAYIHFYGGKTLDGWIIVEIKKVKPIKSEMSGN